MKDIFGNSLIANTDEEIGAVSGKTIPTQKERKKNYSSIETQCFGLMQGESRFCTSLDSIVHDDRKRG